MSQLFSCCLCLCLCFSENQPYKGKTHFNGYLISFVQGLVREYTSVVISSIEQRRQMWKEKRNNKVKLFCAYVSVYYDLDCLCFCINVTFCGWRWWWWRTWLLTTSSSRIYNCAIKIVLCTTASFVLNGQKYT